MRSTRVSALSSAACCLPLADRFHDCGGDERQARETLEVALANTSFRAISAGEWTRPDASSSNHALARATAFGEPGSKLGRTDLASKAAQKSIRVRARWRPLNFCSLMVGPPQPVANRSCSANPSVPEGPCAIHRVHWPGTAQSYCRSSRPAHRNPARMGPEDPITGASSTVGATKKTNGYRLSGRPIF
jgi:hypothetical protein